MGPIKESLEITKRNGASIAALILRARAHTALGKRQEAIDDLNEAIDINPSNARAYAERAVAFANLGQDSLASKDADRAVELGADRIAIDRVIEQINQKR